MVIPDSDNDLKEKGSLIGLVWLVLGGVLISWLFVFVLLKSVNVTDEQLFNGVNSLFSALAFGGVIMAILLQRRELILQRRELEETRAVLQKQHDQLEAHTASFVLQNFEETFFSLINLHHTIVNSMTTISTMGMQISGRECFLVLFKELQQEYQELLHSEQIDPKGKDEDSIREEAYLNLYKEKQAVIGHYFRNLYNIVRFVDESQVEDKKLYIRLVRAQLSVFELSLLFYNCLSPPGKGFLCLVEKYTLLKTIEDKDLLKYFHRKHYKSTAFDEA